MPIVAGGGLYFPILGLTVLGIMLALMILGLFKGKHWCGNICPHGSLFDFALLRPSRFEKIPMFFRSPVLKWCFFAFFMAMFSYRLMWALGYLGEAEFAAHLGSVFVNQYLVWPTLVGMALALLINPRTWCTFCPMGTMQQIVNKLGKKLSLNRNTEEFVNISVPENCTQCGKCAKACPVQLIPYLNWENSQFKNESCIKCRTCTYSCPSKLLYMDTLTGKKAYRHEEIVKA